MVKGDVISIGRRFRGDLLAIAVVIAVHVIFFFGHYTGEEIYPWDFTSSVSHAQTVGWFEDGSMLHPPRFLPYSSMGFPGWWAIQSGEWYIPLQVVRWLGIKYTFVFASAFQSFHVLFGAIGLYILSRVCGLDRNSSLIGSLVYHFASIFFSNAEHVEFVRAAGLLPWMLIALHPRTLCRHRLLILAAALVIQQYLIAAYAGDIFSGFYTVAALVAVWSLDARRQGIARRYFKRACLAGISGALMAAIKWLIPASQMLGSFVGKPTTEAIRGPHLLTLLFRYGTPNLPGDLTMQSLWVPPIAVLLLLLVPRFSRTLLIGLALAVGGIVAGSLDSTAPVLRHIIPGLSFSRLAHSDWRLPLQIGLSLTAGAAINVLLREKAVRWVKPIAGARIAIILVLLSMLAGVAVGYDLSAIVVDGVLAVVFISLVRLWITVPFEQSNLASGTLVGLCFGFVVTTSYLQHVSYVPGTWRLAWSERAEVATFGQPIADMIHRPRIKTWPRRPARQNFGVPDTRSISGQIDIKLNKAYYEQGFTAFGYDNLGSSEYRDFINDYNSGPDSATVLSFVNHPSQAVISPAAEIPDLSIGAACLPDAESCVQGGIKATFKVRQYLLDGAIYAVSVHEPIRLMENEPFYPGFSARLCGASECQKLWPSPGPADLRVWTLPAGDWVMTVSYQAPLLTLSIMMWAIGLALALTSALPWTMFGGRISKCFATSGSS